MEKLTEMNTFQKNDSVFCFLIRCVKGAVVNRTLPSLHEGSLEIKLPVSEFNKFELQLKYAKNRFKLSAGLNREKLNTILI